MGTWLDKYIDKQKPTGGTWLDRRRGVVPQAEEVKLEGVEQRAIASGGGFEPPERNILINAFRNVGDMLSPTLWAMGLGAIAGGVAKSTASLFGVETPANMEQYYQGKGLVNTIGRNFWNAQSTLPELGKQVIDPYTSFEKYKAYAYQNPVYAVMDALFIADIGKKATQRIMRGPAKAASNVAEKAAINLETAKAEARIAPEFAPLRAEATLLEGKAKFFEGAASAQDIHQQRLEALGIQNAPTVESEINRSIAILREAEVASQEAGQWAFRKISVIDEGVPTPTAVEGGTKAAGATARRRGGFGVTYSQEYTWVQKQLARTIKRINIAQDRVNKMIDVGMTLQGKEAQRRLNTLAEAKRRLPIVQAAFDRLNAQTQPLRDIQVAALENYNKALENAGFMAKEYSEGFRAATQKQINQYAEQAKQARFEADIADTELAAEMRASYRPQTQQYLAAAEKMNRAYAQAALPVPGSTMQYGVPPEVGSLKGTLLEGVSGTPLEQPAYGALRLAQRTPAQQWLISIMDWYKQTGDLQTVQETESLTKTMQGLPPESLPQVRGIFLAASQFGYDRITLMNLVEQGKIPPQVINMLDVWQDIIDKRQVRFVTRKTLGVATEGILGKRADMPNKILGMEWDDDLGRLTSEEFRNQMGAFEQNRIDAMWDGVQHNIIPELPDPMKIREDMKYTAIFPELFDKKNAVEWVSPRYYEHQFATDLALSAWGENLNKAKSAFAESVSKKISKRKATGEARGTDITGAETTIPKPGFTKLSEGQLIKRGLYRIDIENTLVENVRRVNSHETLFNILSETFDAYNERKAGKMYANWKFGKPVPEGYRAVNFPAYSKWTKQLEKQISALVNDVTDAGATVMDDVWLSETIEKQMTKHQEFAGVDGDWALIPNEVAEHIKYHLGPMSPTIDVLTDPLGTRTFWTNFVLALRTAWYVNNEVSQAALATVFREWKGAKMGRKLGNYYALQGGTAATAISPELNIKNMFSHGGSWGRDSRVVRKLEAAGLGFYVDIESKLNNMAGVKQVHQLGKIGAQFNLLRDTFYKRNAFLGETAKEFERNAARGVGMNVGTKVFSPVEVKQIAQNFNSMIDSIQTIIEGINRGGDPAFFRDMVTKASHATYNWNNMTPFQRRYLSRFIPFVGWQLYVTGLLWKLPVYYPGRAWLLKSLSMMGQNYIRDLWTEQGIDPDTVPEWERHAIPLYTTPDGRVVAFRASFGSLYDVMDISDYGRSAFSHPALKSALEILMNKKTFPELETPSQAPLERGVKAPRRGMFDIMLDSLFGSAYQMANKIAHPYYQYETGGLTNPQPYINQAGERIPYDWRKELLPSITGISMRQWNSYDMMNKMHGQTYRSTRDAFDGLNAYVAEEWRTRGAAEQRSHILDASETYLKRAYLYLDQIDEMFKIAETPKDRKQLISDRKSYMRQIHRVENIRTKLIESPDILIDPRWLHSKGWDSPVMQQEKE